MRRLLVSFVVVVIVGLLAFFAFKYRRSEQISVKVEELSNTEYPDDPADKSVHYGRYGKRTLQLNQVDETHYDFVFTSNDPNVASIAFRNIDLKLLVPAVPDWIDDGDLETITLVEREWNRQEIAFDPHSSHVEIEGGDGWERANIASLKLARNCLNAGLFEVLLVTSDGLYYHGWFDFPLGHYRSVFDHTNKASYWSHWYRLEHWIDPAGRKVDLDKLRRIKRRATPNWRDLGDEPILAKGEQRRKTRTIDAPGARAYRDLFALGNDLKLATFLKPGRYEMDKPWDHQLQQIATLEGIEVRKIDTPKGELDEVELTFEGGNRLLVSGISLHDLLRLREEDYPRGLYMPMGIAVPPVYQTYDDLVANPPQESPYFSVFLDDKGRWINHHQTGVDGVVMHRDRTSSEVHLYLLSYERHTLLGHYTFQLTGI